MKVILKYYDSSSLSEEEVVSRAKESLGVQPSSIEIYPDSNDPLDHIYFGIQQLVTYRQLDMLFQAGPLYGDKLSALKAEIMSHLEDELDRVISDNEHKVSDD